MLRCSLYVNRFLIITYSYYIINLRIITTALTIGADVLGYANNIPDLYQGIVGTSGVWVGLLTGLARKRNKHVQKPYTYLGHIKRGFSLYPNSERIFANAAFWEKYNYTLYRGFEEFIND